VIHRLGLFRLAMFFAVRRVRDLLGTVSCAGRLGDLHLDELWDLALTGLPG